MLKKGETLWYLFLLFLFLSLLEKCFLKSEIQEDEREKSSFFRTNCLVRLTHSSELVQAWNLTTNFISEKISVSLPAAFIPVTRTCFEFVSQINRSASSDPRLLLFGDFDADAATLENVLFRL